MIPGEKRMGASQRPVIEKHIKAKVIKYIKIMQRVVKKSQKRL